MSFQENYKRFYTWATHSYSWNIGIRVLFILALLAGIFVLESRGENVDWGKRVVNEVGIDDPILTRANPEAWATTGVIIEKKKDLDGSRNLTFSIKYKDNWAPAWKDHVNVIGNVVWWGFGKGRAVGGGAENALVDTDGKCYLLPEGAIFKRVDSTTGTLHYGVSSEGRDPFASLKPGDKVGLIGISSQERHKDFYGREESNGGSTQGKQDFIRWELSRSASPKPIFPNNKDQYHRYELALNGNIKEGDTVKWYERYEPDPQAKGIGLEKGLYYAFLCGFDKAGQKDIVPAVVTSVKGDTKGNPSKIEVMTQKTQEHLSKMKINAIVLLSKENKRERMGPEQVESKSLKEKT